MSDTVSGDFHIDSLAARVADAEQALKEARKRWYESLPELVGDKCPNCGADWTEYGHLTRVEEGYSRFTNGQMMVEEAPAFAHWSTDGWDDMSESGEFEYVWCSPFNGGCGAAFQIPDDEEWDY